MLIHFPYAVLSGNTVVAGFYNFTQATRYAHTRTYDPNTRIVNTRRGVQVWPRRRSNDQ